MTDAEKDAAWRSLPDGFKKEVSRHYKNWHNSLAFGGECAVLDYIFGKHNLTATAQEPPLKATAAESLIQMAKDEMGVANNDTPKSGTPNWLAYRMELAKEVTPKVISALSDNGVSSVFCESVIDKVATIVDGIVERLKGGDNGKV